MEIRIMIIKFIANLITVTFIIINAAIAIIKTTTNLRTTTIIRRR